MPPEIVNGIKRLIERRSKKLSVLHIGWFGGEPLIAKDIVFDILAFAKDSCSRKGVGFSSSLTTNGYFLDLETFSNLVELNATTYQITLDGDAEEHDCTRVLASGRGTFDRIWGNLQAIHQTNLSFNILLRMHITKQNVATFAHFAEKVLSTFAHDKRFDFFTRPVSDFGGASQN